MGFNEFKYKVDRNDETIKVIKNSERFFGYAKTKPTNFSRDIKQLAIDIFRDHDLFDDYEFSKEDFDKEYVGESKAFWNNEGIVLPKIHLYKEGYDTDKIFDGNHLAKDFLDNIKLGYPTDLPREYTDGSQQVTARGSYIDFFGKNTIVFKDVVLPEVEKRACSVIYAHELTHVGLDEARGGSEWYTNRETLPILIELLFANSLNDPEIMDKIIKRRLAYLASVIADVHDHPEMPFEKRIKLESYIKSIIQGVTLFTVSKDDENSKKEIITDINKVFSEELLTEHLLAKYDADYETADKNVKTLKRHMSR